MKKLIFTASAAVALLLSSCTTTGSLAGMSGAGSSTSSDNNSALTNLIGGLLEGVLSQSDVSLEDMVGTWRIDGSAVSFKSENFLKKAGGAAAASAIESKLDPYLQKYGLLGESLAIYKDNTFKMTFNNGGSMSGTVSKNDDGSFEFKFTALGAVSLGSMKAYVQKTGTTMDLLFDANRLKKLMSGAAAISGNSIANSAASLLNGYDGILAGFKCTRVGNAVKDNLNGKRPTLKS